MTRQDYKRRWLALRRAMLIEAWLAERDYGVPKLHPRRHADITANNRGRAEVLRKLLKEDRR